jgi:transcriptional regulator with XRE-family HTH domain
MARERTYPAQRRTKLTSGIALRNLRELNELTQAELAEKSGLSQATISALENDRKGLGVVTAAKLAVALNVHPSVLAFPNWDPKSVKVA